MSKVFLLTGSSRGLGRQIAEATLAAGHRLIATARRPESLSDLRDQYGAQILAVALDVADPTAAQDGVAAGVDEFGRLDVVVNNAGHAELASVEDMTLEAFRDQLDTNLFGVVNVTKAALPILRRQGAGHVIQISSIGGRLATAGLSAYQAAKWAVGGCSALGDPAKVAQVVLTLAAMDRPPLRLILGSEAYAYATAAARTRAEADAQWRELSISTDRDDATEADRDPLGTRAALRDGDAPAGRP